MEQTVPPYHERGSSSFPTHRRLPASHSEEFIGFYFREEAAASDSLGSFIPYHAIEKAATDFTDSLFLSLIFTDLSVKIRSKITQSVQSVAIAFFGFMPHQIILIPAV